MQYRDFDEHSLLCLMKQQDEEMAFKELFLRHQDNVFRYAFKLVRSREAAEEILQDVFLKVWNYRKKVDENREFSFLLFKITKNTILTALKTPGLQVQLTGNTVDTLIHHIAPDDDIIWRQYIEILDKALSTLPGRCREIFQMSRFEGLTYDEIAQKLGISKDTVRLQIIKSLKLLRTFLANHPEVDLVLPLLYLLIIGQN